MITNFTEEKKKHDSDANVTDSVAVFNFKLFFTCH